MAVPKTMRTTKDHMVASIMSLGFSDFWQSQRIHARSGEAISSQVLLQERREDTAGNSLGDKPDLKS